MRLSNTLTGQLEELEPLEEGRLGIYVCGVTPYEESHVGHAMSAIIYDVLVRYLRWEGNPAGGYEVSYVSNYTDVDDKVIARASELGRDPLELVNENIAQWEEQQRALNLLEPDVRPRVTTHIETIVAAIEGIVEAGYGYVTYPQGREDTSQVAGDVYYRVRALESYGKLSHQNIEQLESGTRGEPGEGKEFPLDFALWKAAKATSQGEETSPGGEPSWPSPWGEGRPGWHIECSAMSQHYLGASFDIHGGGLDLVFPHHENEIAQAEAVTGAGSFAQRWLHNGLVQRDGEKMSKSIGNVVTVADALERWRPDALRLFVLGSHYRSPNNLTDEALAASEAGVDRLLTALRENGDGDGDGAASLDGAAERARFVEAMEDDFNTPRAVGTMFDLARAINRARGAGEDVRPPQAVLRELARVLGLGLEAGAAAGELDVVALSKLASRYEVSCGGSDAESTIEALLAARQEARGARDFELADAIRADLAAAGVEVEDTAEGARWSAAR